jgi:UDP-N-acetylmuramoyl-tripeptide--D-alanyl-D-alanine ligase
VDLLVTLGDLGETIAAGALDAGMARAAVRVCATHEEAANAILQSWQAGDVILIKGSRGMKMEEVARLLRGSAGSP